MMEKTAIFYVIRCMYVYIHMYTYMYVYIYKYIIYMYVYIYICMCIYIYIYIYIYIFVQICAYVHYISFRQCYYSFRYDSDRYGDAATSGKELFMITIY